MPEHISPTAILVGHGEHRDENNQHARSRPVNAKLIDKVQIPTPEAIHQETDQHHGPEHQHSLPRGRHVVLVPERYGAKDELGATEVDAEGHGPVPNEVEPAIDPGYDGRPFAG